MKRPSLQFYPADLTNNAKVKRCSWSARGAWIWIIALLHDSDEYGILRWTLKEIAVAIGAPLALLRELVEKNVLKGADGKHDGYVHTPVHARKRGRPVTLVEAGAGPCWYSSRMVRDEWRRLNTYSSTRFTDAPDPSPTPPFGEGIGESPNPSPNPSPNGAPEAAPTPRLGAGASSSSSSTSPVGVTPTDRARASPPNPNGGHENGLKIKGQSTWRSDAPQAVAHGLKVGVIARPGESLEAFVRRIDAAEQSHEHRH